MMASASARVVNRDAARERNAVVELDRAKLLGFRDVEGLGIDASTLRRALDELHNRIGETPPA
jgi:hypothetical protein